MLLMSQESMIHQATYVVVSIGERVLAEYMNFTRVFQTLTAIQEAALQHLSMKREDSKDDLRLTINTSS